MWQIVMIILTSVIDGRTNTAVDNIRVGNMPISLSIQILTWYRWQMVMMTHYL